MALTDAAKTETAAIVEWVLGIVVRTPASEDGGDFSLVDVARAVGVLHAVDGAPAPNGSETYVRWTAPELERSWLLAVAPGTGVLERQPEIRAALRRVEWCGISYFGPLIDPSDRGRASPVLGAVAALGMVAGAGVLTGEHPPLVRITPDARALSSAHLVNDVVEDHAWQAEVRQRLTATANERHLFVWIDDADIQSRFAMEADVPPAPPTLPPEVTCVWVARRPAVGSSLLADRVWQTDESGEWQALGEIRRAAAMRLAAYR